MSVQRRLPGTISTSLLQIYLVNRLLVYFVLFYLFLFGEQMIRRQVVLMTSRTLLTVCIVIALTLPSCLTSRTDGHHPHQNQTTTGWSMAVHENVTTLLGSLLDGYDIRLRPQFGGNYIRFHNLV